MVTQSLDTARVAPAASPARKVASVASVLFAVTLFLTVASVNVPMDASNQELLTWWQDGANQTAGITSMSFAIAAAILFAVVANHIRALVTSAAGETDQLLARFGHSMATAFTATLLVSAALRGVIGQLVKVDEEPLPGLDVLRYSTALNYALIGTVVMTVLAASMLAFSSVIIRTRALARWVGVLGIVCALVIVGAIVMSVGAFAIPLALLWALGLAVAIWRQPAR